MTIKKRIPTPKSGSSKTEAEQSERKDEDRRIMTLEMLIN
jgi:hypothetical protein